MYLLNTHTHKLRFYINSNISEEDMDKWKKLKFKCEGGDNKEIILLIKSNCRLEENKNLPYLNRFEGGLGGNNKQIRFRDNELWYYLATDENIENLDNDIYFDKIFNTENEKWTYQELDDLINAFIKTANDYIENICVNGCIEMRCNSPTYLDY